MQLEALNVYCACAQIGDDAFFILTDSTKQAINVKCSILQYTLQNVLVQNLRPTNSLYMQEI